MLENWLLVAISVLVGSALLSGCAAPGRPMTASPIAESNIIFNPHWTTPVVAGADRTPWPVIFASDEMDPDSYFRETVTDRQGHSGHNRDYYLRRVDSTRIRQSGR